MSIDKTIFMAYDVRGVYPTEINEEAVRAIGKAYARWLKPKNVIVGHDVRLSSPDLQREMIAGLTGEGVDVVNIGTISTDMLYYAVATEKAGGGITITASHNPREYNGAKFVREKAIAISSDSGLNEIADLIDVDNLETENKPGKVTKKDITDGYIEHIRSFIDVKKLGKLKVVVNGNFGLAVTMIKKALAGTPVELIELNGEPDGSFPKGRPDPLIPENRHETIQLIIKEGADLGIAWDADADRVFFYDENGDFIDGYYMTAILAEMMLKKYPDSKIVHEPRLVWAIKDAIQNNGGTAIQNKAGHTFIKDRMRKEDAVFAGETSAHYYFKDNFYCDNGMIPALMILERLSESKEKLSDIAQPYRDKYFISGEINSEVDSGEEIIKQLEKTYSDGQIDKTDGLVSEYSDWRFNVRMSNTEPLIRLNVEAKSQDLMEKKRDELLSIIRS